MEAETLEGKISKTESDKKSGIWDFLVSAYSSSKAVKVGLLAIAAGTAALAWMIIIML